MRRNAAANRERILVAAEEVFGAQGAAGSTEEVARRAEVGIATVFRHFPTKEVLVEAALLRHFAGLEQRAADVQARDDPGEAFRELVITMIETGASKVTLAGLLIDQGESLDAVRGAADGLRTVVGDALERARAAGAVRDDVTVDEVYFLVRGLAQARATMPPAGDASRGAIDIVLRGLARSGSSPAR